MCNAGRVVVTGGCGYIGSHTVLELLKAEYEALSPEFEIDPAPFCLSRSSYVAIRWHDKNVPRVFWIRTEPAMCQMIRDFLLYSAETETCLH